MMKGLRRAVFVAIALSAGAGLPARSLEAQPLHPQWSPTGAWIAYYQRDGNAAAIYIVRPDGTDRTVLTTGPNYDANPTWGPGGHELAFARGVGGMRETWDIFVLDVGAERERRLTDTPEREMHTSWSPDGLCISFVQLGEEGSDIYVMNADGSDVRRLTETPHGEFHPKWSPDSRRLIYDAGDRSGSDIWVIDVQTGEATQLTHVGEGESASAPAWSPDGSQFTFAMRGEDSPEALYVANADGSDARPVGTGGLAAGASSWSPDGAYIAFHAAVGDTWAVYVVHVGGDNVLRVSD